MVILEELFFRLGIPEYTTDIVTPLPFQSTPEIPIAKILQTDVGWIYGLSVYADRVDPVSGIAITTTQAENLYLQLRNGTINFGQYIALDDLLATYAGTPVSRPVRYLPYNIPGTYAEPNGEGVQPHFDISTSSFLNPLGYLSAASPAPQTIIRLKVWYIPTFACTQLAKHGYFNIDHPRHHPPGHIKAK